jgi:beta-glucosidase
MSFPDGFLWGVAAAAYQIEGGAAADGRRPCVWDALCKRPGAVFGGHRGDVACDHFHRYPEDVALIADLGAKAYRLSVSWPRILPTGEGKPSDAGLDLYDRIVDALLTRGIQPWVTLFHWDFPLELFQRGGWLNRDSVKWFADYTEAVVRRLGDRVQYWMTLNEPQCFLGLGHATGVHAPGMKYSRPEVLRATHHALLAHSRAVQVIREAAAVKPHVGWAMNGYVCYPATASAANVEAARTAMFSVPQGDDWFFCNTWYTEPTLCGRYPEDGLRRFGQEMPKGFERDLENMRQPLDFFGVNLYQGHPITAGPDGKPVRAPRPPGYAQTLSHWPVEPEVMYWGPRFLHERYELPIYITENGCASMDWVHQDGLIHDAPRIDYIARHLVALRQAIQQGADVRGYFHWSILDNFEWAEGYRMRFGLIYVDYQTLERIPKDSYMWYQQVVLSNGACLPANPVPLR